MPFTALLGLRCTASTKPNRPRRQTLETLGDAVMAVPRAGGGMPRAGSRSTSARAAARTSQTPGSPSTVSSGGGWWWSPLLGSLSTASARAGSWRRGPRSIPPARGRNLSGWRHCWAGMRRRWGGRRGGGGTGRRRRGAAVRANRPIQSAALAGRTPSATRILGPTQQQDGDGRHRSP